jgi:hypothetical protein
MTAGSGEADRGGLQVAAEVGETQPAVRQETFKGIVSRD